MLCFVYLSGNEGLLFKLAKYLDYHLLKCKLHVMLHYCEDGARTAVGQDYCMVLRFLSLSPLYLCIIHDPGNSVLSFRARHG